MVLVTLLAFLLSLLLGSIAGRLADRYDRKNNVKIKDGSDANAIVGYMMSVILEGALHEEMNEELGYSKYDSRNKKQKFWRDNWANQSTYIKYGEAVIRLIYTTNTWANRGI